MSINHRKLAAVVLPVVLALAFVVSSAAGIYGAGPATAVAATTDGRAEVASRLNQDYRELRVGQATLKVDRYVYREDDDYIAGIIKVADFAAWDSAMRNSPEVLRQFLKGIADQVSPLATQGRYEISWMVLDVAASKPANFESAELTALPDGTWGVIRPLAHTACLYCKYGGGSVFLSTLSYTGPVTYRWKPGTIYFPALDELTAFAGITSADSAAPDKITQALEILNQQFLETRIGDLTLRVAGYSQADAPARTIVGMIRLADYPSWEQAIRQKPKELTTWLSSAGKQVQHLASGQFELSWAVVDLAAAKPSGFAASEAIRRGIDQKYLVVRPLAYTPHLGGSNQVTLRPASSLPTGSGPVASNWKPGTTVYLPKLDNYVFTTTVPVVAKAGRPPITPTVQPDTADQKAITALKTAWMSRRTEAGLVTVSDVQSTGTKAAPSLLVTMTAAEYEAWEMALYVDEAGLAGWLYDMTEAARRGGGRTYRLTWAVVDVVANVPEGFAKWEVADVHGSRKLLVRTLATTIDTDSGLGIMVRQPTDIPHERTELMGYGEVDWVTTYRPMLFFNAAGDALELLP